LAWTDDVSKAQVSASIATGSAGVTSGSRLRAQVPVDARRRPVRMNPPVRPYRPVDEPEIVHRDKLILLG